MLDRNPAGEPKVRLHKRKAHWLYLSNPHFWRDSFDFWACGGPDWLTIVDNCAIGLFKSTGRLMVIPRQIESRAPIPGDGMP